MATIEKKTMPRPRGEIRNAESPSGQFGAYLRTWIDKHHGGDESRLAKTLKRDERTIRNWMTGTASPVFADLDTVAQAMGFADWVDLAIAIRRHRAKR